MLLSGQLACSSLECEVALRSQLYTTLRVCACTQSLKQHDMTCSGGSSRRLGVQVCATLDKRRPASSRHQRKEEPFFHQEHQAFVRLLDRAVCYTGNRLHVRAPDNAHATCRHIAGHQQPHQALPLASVLRAAPHQRRPRQLPTQQQPANRNACNRRHRHSAAMQNERHSYAGVPDFVSGPESVQLDDDISEVQALLSHSGDRGLRLPPDLASDVSGAIAAADLNAADSHAHWRPRARHRRCEHDAPVTLSSVRLHHSHRHTHVHHHSQSVSPSQRCCVGGEQHEEDQGKGITVNVHSPRGARVHVSDAAGRERCASAGAARRCSSASKVRHVDHGVAVLGCWTLRSCFAICVHLYQKICLSCSSENDPTCVQQIFVQALQSSTAAAGQLRRGSGAARTKATQLRAQLQAADARNAAQNETIRALHAAMQSRDTPCSPVNVSIRCQVHCLASNNQNQQVGIICRSSSAFSNRF